MRLRYCEDETCENVATSEYSYRDEEGDVYYTDRCVLHPASDEFNEEPLDILTPTNFEGLDPELANILKIFTPYVPRKEQHHDNENR